MSCRSTLRKASLAALLIAPALAAFPATAQQSRPAATTAKPAGVLQQAEVDKLLPPSVFFKGQSAPLQLRNAAAIRFADSAVLFAGLVDNSGYSTGVRERYQFYFVTETAVEIAGKQLPAGAYGAGFLDDGSFLIMDIGGHDFMNSATATDDTLHRPRPLQIIAGESAAEFRLYLGRRYAVIRRPTQ